MSAEPLRVLLVEDSAFFAWAVQRQLEAIPDLRIEHAKSLDEARRLLADGEPFGLALLDYLLPDSTEGEVVRMCRNVGIPTIVCSGDTSAEFRRQITALEVIDYIVKDTPSSLANLSATTARVIRNRSTKALVVDDSKKAREGIRQWLSHQQFATLAAADGEEAVAMLAEHQDIRLAIVDLDGPEAEAIATLRAIRATHAAESLAIIAIVSDAERANLVVKHGASDFLAKPARREELVFRVNRAMEVLDKIATIQDLMERDTLTRLFNRRYLIEVGGKLFASQKRGKMAVTLALVDVDQFTAFNERYGHVAGDGVLAAVAGCLRANTRETDVVCRYGGGVFGVLVVNLPPEMLSEYFERLRSSLNSRPIGVGVETVTISASLGVCSVAGDNIEGMLKMAEGALRRAKAGGGNRIEFVS